MRLARQIGDDLYNDYLADASFAPHAAGLSRELGDVADAIFDKAGQPGVVRAVGLPDPALWPGTDDVGKHFCVYRPLARLVREDLMEEAITFNYDCGHEAGLKAEGFLRSPRTERGQGVARPRDSRSQTPARTRNYSCTGRFHSLQGAWLRGALSRARSPSDEVSGSGHDHHSQTPTHLCGGTTRGYVTHSVIVRGTTFCSLSDSQAKIRSYMAKWRACWSKVYTSAPPDGLPRVVVIDYEPDTAALRTLIRSGCGWRGRSAQCGDTDRDIHCYDHERHARAAGGGIGTETFLSGVGVPDDMEPRLAALLLSAPVMLRWAYLLRKPADNQYVQRVNLQQAAEHGYVPLTLDPQTAARALQTRAELRQELGLTEPETINEALTAHGFVVDGGCAFLPVGLDHDELVPSCRPGGPIDHARRSLGHPTHLDCILVSDGPGGRRGVNIDTGKEVPVP